MQKDKLLRSLRLFRQVASAVISRADLQVRGGPADPISAGNGTDHPAWAAVILYSDATRTNGFRTTVNPFGTMLVWTLACKCCGVASRRNRGHPLNEARLASSATGAFASFVALRLWL